MTTTPPRRAVEVAPALFGSAAAEVVGSHEVVERVRAGRAARFVVDGADDADLRAAAEAVDALEREGVPVVTASPGGWLRHHGARNRHTIRDAYSPRYARPTLISSGSERHATGARPTSPSPRRPPA